MDMAGPSRSLDFVFFDAGGGHRAAANALKAVIDSQYPDWQVRLVNLQEILDELDVLRKVTGIRGQDIYNLLLKKGWTLGTAQVVPAMHWLIRQYHTGQVRVLRRFWSESKPDLVVSLIPNFARAVYEGLQQARPQTPLVTVLTDIADYPPNFWMVPGQEQYWVCGSAKAVEQARAMGYGPERVFAVSGMVLHPRFYERPPLDRVAERQRLGLQADVPTGVILFGGQGSPESIRILERVEAAGLPAQFIVICGKNEALRAKLAGRRWRMPVFVEGFTSEVPYYMRLADFFIGKPGPGSISEAAALHLPMLLECNAWTLPQERYNTEWVRDNDFGVVMGSFREIAPAVKTLLSEGRLDRYRANLAKLRNEAVFEIPPILDKIMSR